MSRWPYTNGLHDLGGGSYAYLQPDRGTGAGWSNAGFVVDGSDALLIDTLRDEVLTSRMLGEIERATGFRPADIRTLVNTHRDADHVYGNRLLQHAEIIASDICAQEMKGRSPKHVLQWLRDRPQGIVGEYIWRIWGPPFHFEGFEPAQPTRTFSGELEITVGRTPVRLIEVGPAHTPGDIIVYLPDRRLVYAADIVFLGNTPAIWAGPVSSWVAAIDLIDGLDVDVIVPGHGPITDKEGLKPVRRYLTYVEEEARKRYDAGMSVSDAARDIDLGEFRHWSAPERIVQNVDICYRHFRGETKPIGRMELFELLAPLAKEMGSFPADLSASPA